MDKIPFNVSGVCLAETRAMIPRKSAISLACIPWISTSGLKKMQPNFWTLPSGFYPMARSRQTESQLHNNNNNNKL
jgi:hypothetical protein